ncbi:electron transfer flavoprotein subunit beta/FixA family protein [Agromyces seonyuensis]|uniref:Electron transfer flavoprotein subunit beta n=1 Tax=Agromyces seonyuensis TaxID=2662446 RepID=A0A6I4NRR9_9MICO|nr:electron transfer flavoprotein subunit beta/FixA family protein [Agromyces seonyuensis]MWB97168.1 electron transfer flavoprotein subunit beta [Agromyces seonyuensis]
MKIVVLVKDVPDTYGDRKLDLETGLADRAASEHVPDEISERALETALRIRESRDGVEIVVLSMGAEAAGPSLRKALAMGADRAVHVVDPALAGADLGLTAEVLAAAIRREGFDLVIAGDQSTDGGGGAIPAMLAELLDAAQATGLDSLDVAADGASLTGARGVDGGVQRLSAELPAVVSITERLPDPRFANFKGIMAAKKKPLEQLALADLEGVPAPEAPEVPHSILVSVAARPPRTAGVKITDDGEAGRKLAAYLVEHRLV